MVQYVAYLVEGDKVKPGCPPITQNLNDIMDWIGKLKMEGNDINGKYVVVKKFTVMRRKNGQNEYKFKDHGTYKI